MPLLMTEVHNPLFLLSGLGPEITLTAAVSTIQQDYIKSDTVTDTRWK